MLVLTRKVGEQIIINKDIVVTITKVRGQRICLAVEAPRSVPIRRAELAAGQAAEPAEDTALPSLT